MRTRARRLTALVAIVSTLGLILSVVGDGPPRARADSQNVSITDALAEAADTESRCSPPPRPRRPRP
jgi:hypothetical protein